MASIASRSTSPPSRPAPSSGSRRGRDGFRSEAGAHRLKGWSTDEPQRKPVLIAYDGSDHAKYAIEQAGGELRTPRKAAVLAAYAPLGSFPFWGGPTGLVPDEVFDEVGKEAQKTADEGAELAAAAGFDASSIAKEGERPWQTILDAAKEVDAGVIVLGSHGRGSVESAVLGSVATAVAQHAYLPVMICRPAEQP